MLELINKPKVKMRTYKLDRVNEFNNKKSSLKKMKRFRGWSTQRLDIQWYFKIRFRL